MEYKVLTLWEPWATLLVHGVKKIETRPSPTNWTVGKGTYLIHAAKKWGKFQSEICQKELFKLVLLNIPSCGIDGQEFALGHIIGSIEITGCYKIINNDCSPLKLKPHFFNGWNGKNRLNSIYVQQNEESFGDYRHGRYAWICQNPRVLVNPIPYKGGQGYYQNFNGDESELIFKN